MRGVGLAVEHVVIDLDTADFSGLARQTEPPQLLEDIDVADEEFEDWLRNQRTVFEQRIASSTPASPATRIPAAPRAAPASLPVRAWHASRLHRPVRGCAFSLL